MAFTTMDDPDIAKPWERQSDEGEEAFEAFDIFTKMGSTRSCVRVANQLQKSESLIYRWSSRYLWPQRARAWDNYENRETNEALALGKAEMRKRFVTISKNIQVRVQQRIELMQQADIAKLKPSELVGMFRAAAQIEAIARDIPTSELEGKANIQPIFIIDFTPSKPPNMIHVRTADGRDGFIPPGAKEKFLADFPDATVIYEGEAVEPAAFHTSNESETIDVPQPTV
jgi:hypothetical protein